MHEVFGGGAGTSRSPRARGRGFDSLPLRDLIFTSELARTFRKLSEVSARGG
jgi:hypothetical protein